MGILIDRSTPILVQGITGNQGSFHAGQMVAYGTQVVAGTSPGKGGSVHHGVPVFDRVRDAVKETGASASVMFVPAPFAKDAAFEALAAGIKLLVMVPEHVPVQDTIAILEYARYQGALVLGPNTFGLITAGQAKMGIPPNHIFQPGPIGIVARSGTLSYEIADALTRAGLGQTTAVGMGGDPVAGQTFNEILHRFAQDPQTELVVMVGEIGGSAEEEAASFIQQMNKPVVAYLAGKAAPVGKRMGHAGAIIERGRGTLESKRQALEAAGATVVEMPWDVVPAVRRRLA
jgi:succinyl-CoA synthetase alpha subunit